jgi:acetyltransferase-like isoleucine patch superfamily enzyme
MPFFSSIIDGEVFKPTKEIIIFGNGDHARTVFGYFFDEKLIKGFVVDDPFVQAKSSIGSIAVEPVSKIIEIFPPDEHAVLVALAFKDLNEFRMRKSNELRNLGYDFVGFIDRSVRVPSSYSVEANTIILGNSDIHEGTSIGEGVFVSSGAVLGHDAILENYSWIGSGAVLAGAVRVGEYCVLGMNASVKQNAILAHHTLVSPNSFVNMDTAAYSSIVSGKVVPVDSRKLHRFSYK